jgi:transcriptional regulator with XRE-family HTH domain
MQRFGEKLRALRQHHALTVRDLTRALGYTGFGYIHSIETGKIMPRVEFVLKVADYFNVSLDQLLRDNLELTLHGDADNQADAGDSDMPS